MTTTSISAGKPRVALIGLGMVADTHLQALVDLSASVQLQGVFSRNYAKTQLFAEVASERCCYAVAAFESMQELTSAGVDFVILATPPNARKEFVEVCCKAGIHILMEKPIERTLDAANELVDLCEASDIELGIVFQHRARVASCELQQWITANKAGKLNMVEVCVPWWRDQAYYDEPRRGTYERDGGGVLISQAIHTLDLMLNLTGDVREVRAMCSTTLFHQMESEDFVTAALQFENGAVGSLLATTAAFPGEPESIKLHFEKAVAILARGQLELLWRDGRKETFGENATTGGGADPMAFTSDWHRDIIANFVSHLTTGEALTVSGREALKVHRLIKALVESSRLGQPLVL